jgi:hypothetical protein
MPQAQVIDLTPSPRTEATSLERTVASFAQQNRKNQVERQESDALRDIYAQYQNDGQNLEKTIKDIQTRPGISPTTRVNTIDQLLRFQQHNNTLQKEAQTKLEKANEIEKGKTIIKDLEKRRGLEEGSLNAYGGDYKAAEMASRPKKEPVGTQASKPIEPSQLKSIQEVEATEEYKKASPSEKARLLRNANVSKENTKSVVENFEEELKNKPGQEYTKLREKAVAEFVTTALDQRDHAEELEYSFDTAKKAIESGDVEGPGITALIKNNPYGQLMLGLNPSEAALVASNKKLLEGSKSIFGSKPTEREIFLLLNSMLPSIGKTKEANLASLYFIEKLNKLKIMHGDITEELSKDGYVADIQSQVNQRMKPFIAEYKAELEEGVAALKTEEMNKDKGKLIRVKSPDGKIGTMTQENIDKAKANDVIFTPA